MHVEQARGATAGIKVDSWALAAILLECWTGQSPHGGADAPRTLELLAADTAPDIKAAVAAHALPQELATALMPCFAAAPKQRPSAHALWLDLCKARSALLTPQSFSAALNEHWVCFACFCCATLGFLRPVSPQRHLASIRLTSSQPPSYCA